MLSVSLVVAEFYTLFIIIIKSETKLCRNKNKVALT